MAERNAASVLPDPVGAAIRVWRPSRMSGHPSSCGAVGSPSRLLNQVRTAGWKGSSAVITGHSTGKGARRGTVRLWGGDTIHWEADRCGRRIVLPFVLILGWAGLGRGSSAQDKPAAGGQSPGQGHVRRRLLLVHGAAVRRAARCGLHDLGLHRGAEARSDVRGGLGRRHGPHGGGRGPLRPRQGDLRAPPRRLLAQRGPDGTRPAVLRRRQPVPDRDLLPRRDAEAPGRAVEAGAGEGQALQGADRHRDRPRGPLLPRGGVPPGLLQEEPGALQVLPLRTAAATAGSSSSGARPPRTENEPVAL